MLREMLYFFFNHIDREMLNTITQSRKIFLGCFFFFFLVLVNKIQEITGGILPRMVTITRFPAIYVEVFS